MRPQIIFTMKKLIPLLFAGLLFGQTMKLAAQPAPAPMPPEARQFDFWLGEWEVFGPDGALGGHSRIESVAGGHALLENWSDADGTSGKSLNIYNPDKKLWQQFWVGATSPVLELSGGLQGGSMVLSGTRTSVHGGTVTDRITWTPRADGSVRQLWETSKDDGKTWQVNFDGIYKPKK